MSTGAAPTGWGRKAPVRAPGPAAYGLGGDRPTVTDANLVLGRLDPANFLGGEMTLDVDAARRVIGRLAEQVGLGEPEAAEGVVTILNSNMANAIRAQTIQRGLDPRGFSLVALGGAGPLHAAEVAAMLDIPKVIVPPHPGITSAAGLLTTDLKYDAVKTAFQTSDSVEAAALNAGFAWLEDTLVRAVCRRRLRARPDRPDPRRRPALCRPGLRTPGRVSGRTHR